MGHARNIGRVGALAAALGIGLAVASSPTAWADSEETTTSARDRAATRDDSAGRAEKQTRRVPAQRDGSATTTQRSTDDRTRRSQDEIDDTAIESDDLPAQRTERSRSRELGDFAESAEARETDLSSPAAIPEAAVFSQVATEAVTLDVSADHVVVDEPATEKRSLTAALAPLVTPGPDMPGESPILLAMLAAARRPATSAESRLAHGAQATSLIAAVPNTSPTITSISAGTAGLFTAKVKGRVRATDDDGDKLTYVATATKGTVTIDSRGNYTFTPTAAARHASAAIPMWDQGVVTVTVTDGNGGSVSTYIGVSIRPANVKPNARATVGKGNPANGIVTGKINVTDRDGDAVTYVGSGPTSRGTVVVHADGSFVYTPTAAAREQATSIFRRSDRFTVTVNDGHGGVDRVIVRVAIVPPSKNAAPTVGNPSYSITGVNDSNGQVTGYVNIADPDGFGLTYSIVAGIDGATGSLAVDAANGNFTFIPTLGARENAHRSPGEDTVRFTIGGSDGLSTATVIVTAVISPKAPAATDTMQAGQWLEVDKYLQSKSGRYRLYMQGDGNLVLYDEAQNHRALWSSGTNGRPGLRAAMQGDGNLVLYNGGTGVWSTKTNGWNGARVVLQDDGNLVIYAGAVAVWDRHAGVLRHPPTSGGGTLAQKVASFVSTTYGKTVANAAGTFAGECVSLVSQFLRQVHNITTGAWGNAVDYRSGGSGGGQMASRGFTWRTDRNFQDGDILVWGSGTYTTVYGHIGIWHSGRVFDQNSGWHRDVGVRQSGYSQFFAQGYLGYWRKS